MLTAHGRSRVSTRKLVYNGESRKGSLTEEQKPSNHPRSALKNARGGLASEGASAHGASRVSTRKLVNNDVVYAAPSRRKLYVISSSLSTPLRA